MKLAAWKVWLQCLHVIWSVFISGPVEGNVLQCTDYRGKPVGEGQQFIPKSNGSDCKQCYCENGFPSRCFQPQCAAPPNCTMPAQVDVDDDCCPDYNMDNCIVLPNEPVHPTQLGGPKDSDGLRKADSTNLGLRLVASTVTSFLILALLLFLIHRLRQRRMLIMMRRLHGERREEEAVAYMAQFDQVDIGITFPPYEDPPPPYSPPKPTDIPHGEAPPPYTETPAPQHTTTVPPTATQNGSVNSSECARGHRGVNSHSCCSSSSTSAGLRERDEAQTLPKGTFERETHRRSGVSDQNSQQLLRYIEDIEPRNRILSSDTSEDISPGYGFSIALASMSVSPTSSSEQDGALLSATSRPIRSPPESTSLEDSYHSMLECVENTACPRTHYIKRSDSIEIRRQSPRNSYMAVSHSDVSEGHNHSSSQNTPMTQSCDTELLRRCLHGSINHTCSQSPETDTTQQSGLSWVAEGGLGMRAFRIRRQESSPCVTLSRPVRTDNIELLDFSKQKVSSARPDVNCSSGRHSMSFPKQDIVTCQDELRRSLPPLDLPSLNDSSMSNDSCTPASDLYSSGNNNGHGSSPGPPLQAMMNGVIPPQLLSPTSSPSPQPSPALLRSGSVMSQISQFSVCSETGESKQSRRYGNYNNNSSSRARQRSLRNDVQYPPTPATSNMSAPSSEDSSNNTARSVPVSSSSSLSASCSNQSVPSQHGQCATNSQSASFKEAINPCVRTTDQPYRSPDPRTYRKIIYRHPDDVCFTDEGRHDGRVTNSVERNQCLKDTSSRRTSKQSPHKNQSDHSEVQGKCTQHAATNTPERAERVTLRQLKQKRRPHSNPGLLLDGRTGNSPKSDERKVRNRKSLDSPSRLRKPTKTENTQYKEYGFIDKPLLLQTTTGPDTTACSNDAGRSDSLTKTPKGRSGRGKNRERSKSKERNGNVLNGSPTTNGFHVREKSRSRSRESSKPAGKSKKDKCESEVNEERHRCQHSGVSDGNCVTKSGNAESTEKRRHHKSRSPSRRKRQSTGHQYDNILHMATNCNTDKGVNANLSRDRQRNVVDDGVLVDR